MENSKHYNCDSSEKQRIAFSEISRVHRVALHRVRLSVMCGKRPSLSEYMVDKRCVADKIPPPHSTGFFH